jgi:fatty acid desaturase
MTLEDKAVPHQNKERAASAQRKVVFHSVRQEERPRERHYRKDWPIVIVLIILYGALSVLLGLWQAPVPTLISAL